MKGETLFLLEMLLTAGVVLGWAGWELWSLRKKPDSAKPDQKPPDA